MISGAAKDSDPQRVLSMGEDDEMNRESPKSVSFSSGVGSKCSGIEPVEVGGSVNGLTVRMISVCQSSPLIFTYFQA